MIFDIFEKRNAIILGRVHRELRLVRRFGLLRWQWKRRWLFNRMELDPKRNLNSHIMITGESGAGKSNACKLILKRLADQGACFVALDPHAEYTEHAKDFGASVYDASLHAVNPFDLDGLTERERTAEMTAMLRRILHLGEVQASTLYRCISYTYWISNVKSTTPSMHSLLYTIKVFKRRAGSKPESSLLDGLEKRLIVIAGESFRKNVPMSSILRGRSVFALHGLHSAEAQAVYMESMLRKIYTSLLGEGSRRTGRFYIVIDEAEKLADSPVVGRLVAEGRKYGVGIIAISQRAKALDREIRSNAATMIAFAQREPEEQSYIANMIAAGTEYNRFIEVRKALRELPRGWALVQEARERSPKIVKCGRFEAKVRDPSHMIMEMARGVVSKRELIGRLGREGFTPGETVSAVAALIKGGLLKYHVVTEPPYEGTWYIATPRNSAEHDVMVGLISRYLTENGIKNRIYNNAYGPDVIAYKNGGRVAVEYETGMKKPEDTERMLRTRKGGYLETVVLGTVN
ncbi:MAG: ATP-binding protein [Candidatus Micrarchaeota archaeon]|nr:ATP-binding protein [Candidatus Micrarchaeota archaeon]